MIAEKHAIPVSLRGIKNQVLHIFLHQLGINLK